MILVFMANITAAGISVSVSSFITLSIGAGKIEEATA
jgi:hypothetical protein